MYKVIWKKKDNLVKLVNSAPDEISINDPRIVFTNELITLGIEMYSYPQENVPICWCMDRKYFYKGDLLFEAKGGDLYHAPSIVYPKEFKYVNLKPIDVNLLFEENKEELLILQNEAMDFINDQYKTFQKGVDAFAVAFSGGKDSQVVLDLVSKVIPPQRFKAYYTDTGMELPCTYKTVKDTTSKLKELFPEFEMVVCDSETSVVEQWQKYGPPSRMNRWCCKVRKTALFARKLKDVLQTNGQPKCVVFEGVRSDESARRETYNRVGVGVKHVNLINCRPIFDWNDTEVYLYILCLSKVEINEGYTYGLTRIGCNICPFASLWSEYLINKLYPEISKPFISVIETMAKNIGVSSQEKIDDYISSGNWKKNAGGKGLNYDDTRMDIIQKEPNYENVIHNPKQDWKVWMNTIGKYVVDNDGSGNYSGSIKYEDKIIRFSVNENDNKLTTKMYGTSGNIYLTSFMNKVLRKTAFCERCGVCEAECPTGALVIRKDRFTIDTEKCVHCHNCYDVNSYGCIVASRRQVSEGGMSMKSKSVRSSGIDRYSTFGLRDAWVANLMNDPDEWFHEYQGMGPKMIPAAINWLRDALIVDQKDKKLSDFGYIVRNLYLNNPYMAWQIIWINLCFNSLAVQTYVQDLANLMSYKKADIITMMQYRYPELSEATLGNPAGAILNMFDNSPCGCKAEDAEFSNYSLRMGVIDNSQKERSVTKMGTDNISSMAIAYLLYVIAEHENRYAFTVEELYSNKEINGPGMVFNLSEEKFKTILRNLTENGIINAELLGGLDNIKLDSSVTSTSVLSQLVGRM